MRRGNVLRIAVFVVWSFSAVRGVSECVLKPQTLIPKPVLLSLLLKN